MRHTLADPKLTRRHALCCGALAACGLFTSLVPAAETDSPARPARSTPTSQALALSALAFDGLDATQLWDMHTHLLGTGDTGSGCWINPQLDSWWHPLEALRMYNPLLFDFVLKRVATWRGHALDRAVFHTAAHFKPATPA